MIMMRIDLALLELKLVSSRSKAQELILAKKVLYNGLVCEKASAQVDLKGKFELLIDEDDLYVSRGALKIKGALNFFDVSVMGKCIADIGASTGGFTDYSLKNGAIHVYCIDVGHDQLAESLKADIRVSNFEGVNARNPLTIPQVDLAVIDVSFISIKYIIKNVWDIVKDGGEIVGLIKPQFEVGVDGIGKNGIVKSEGHRLVMLHELKNWCQQEKMPIARQCDSPILGKSGNKEYFFYWKKNG